MDLTSVICTNISSKGNNERSSSSFVVWSVKLGTGTALAATDTVSVLSGPLIVKVYCMIKLLTSHYLIYLNHHKLSPCCKLYASGELSTITILLRFLPRRFKSLMCCCFPVPSCCPVLSPTCCDQPLVLVTAAAERHVCLYLPVIATAYNMMPVNLVNDSVGVGLERRCEDNYFIPQTHLCDISSQ